MLFTTTRAAIGNAYIRPSWRLVLTKQGRRLERVMGLGPTTLCLGITGLDSGLRLSELIGLKLADAHIEQGYSDPRREAHECQRRQADI